jgi:MFS family permease
MSRSRHRSTPGSLGSSYCKLWTATAISNLGDGIVHVAVPLLAATLTRDPLQASVVAAAGWLPWLLLALFSGALVDRWDRRRVIWTVNAGRFAIVGALGVAVWAGWASVPVLAVVAFVLGAGQTLFDSAGQSFIPALVGREGQQLERANSRLFGVHQASERLAGRPLGGALFALAQAVPFVVGAVSFAASSALIAAIPGRFASQRPADAARTSLRAEIAQRGCAGCWAIGWCAPSWS